MNKKVISILFLLVVFSGIAITSAIAQTQDRGKVLEIIHKVNNYWQTKHPEPGWAFWEHAAYHTGNMEAYFLTGEEKYRRYSEKWADKNEWKGAKSDDKANWKYGYGEKDEYVLFGDWQTCFQTYADLYILDPKPHKIVRAREVMEYQMSTDRVDYWWWADGLYMVMPVMVKLHKITNNPLYLDKLHEYLSYADDIMYDTKECLYYRDAGYVYPRYKSLNGKKDFWSRGDGWVFAAFAKVLKDLPPRNRYWFKYSERFRDMAGAIKACQHPDGYWTQSLLDHAYVPGPETSGTAFFTYGLFWGINNGYLEKDIYLETALKGWKYLEETALQPNGVVGYVQPIGGQAVKGMKLNENSTANFGVGGFLLAACEYARFLEKEKVNN
jgi:rhamnogalacturonyl hydrolase YesR